MPKKKANKSTKKGASRAPAPKEIKASVPLLPPPEPAEEKKKDEFFDEEEMKQFSVKDEEEDGDEESSDGSDGEPAWEEEID